MDDDRPTLTSPPCAHTVEARRAVVERVLIAWEQAPHLRLGQVLVNAVGFADDSAPYDLNISDVMTLNLMWTMSDADLAAALERWVTAGT